MTVGKSVISSKDHVPPPLLPRLREVEAIMCAADETGAIVTVEEHSVLGGLGGAVAEVLAESGISPLRFKRIGLPSEFAKYVGSQEYLRARYGLSEPAIVQQVLALLDAGPAAVRRRYA